MTPPCSESCSDSLCSISLYSHPLNRSLRMSAHAYLPISAPLFAFLNPAFLCRRLPNSFRYCFISSSCRLNRGNILSLAAAPVCEDGSTETSLYSTAWHFG